MIDNIQNHKSNTSIHHFKLFKSQQLTNTSITQNPKSLLSCEEVKILLQFNTSTNDQQIISNIVKKQILLQKKKMFDPAKYFGQPNIQNLDNQFNDSRIQKMFESSFKKIQLKQSEQSLSSKKIEMNKGKKKNSVIVEINKLIENIGQNGNNVVKKQSSSKLRLKYNNSAPQSPIKGIQNRERIMNKNIKKSTNNVVNYKSIMKELQLNSNLKNLKLKLKINNLK